MCVSLQPGGLTCLLQVLNFLISAEVVWISLTFISVMGLGFGEGVGERG